MLASVWPLRAAAVLCFVTFAIAAAPSRHDDWQIGEIVRGSLRITDDGYTFTLASRFGSTCTDRCTDRMVEVHAEGLPSSTVCDDATVAIEGRRLAHHLFAADLVQGFHDGKYDLCWKLRCQPAAYRACRGPRLFE